MENNKSKIVGIIGLTLIALLTFWTIVIPMVCVFAIIDMVES